MTPSQGKAYKELDTFETLAIISKTRTTCSVGDFLIHQGHLYAITDIPQSKKTDNYALCWFISEGSRLYKTTFLLSAIQALPPIAGVFFSAANAADVSGIALSTDWKLIAEELTKYAVRYPVSSDVTIPFVVEEYLSSGGVSGGSR